MLIGLHHKSDQHQFFGPTAEQLFKKITETIYIYKPVQPFNTLKRMVVVAAPNAELEPGFLHWYDKILTVSKTAGMPISFHASKETLLELEQINQRNPNPAKALLNDFSNWEDFLIFSRDLKPNDLFVIVSSRKDHISYNEHLEKLPHLLSTYFQNNSFLIVYPKQLEQSSTFDFQQPDGSLLETLSEKMNTVGKVAQSLKRIFIKKS